MLRPLLLAAAIAAAAPSFAHAATIALTPVSVSPALAEKLADDYGEREGRVLTDAVARYLTTALERSGHEVGGGAAAYTVSVTIDDAKPNKPTFKQLGERPGLDYFNSFGIGGARLVATITPADGGPAKVVTAKFYENDIRDVVTVDTWHDARRAIRRLASDVVASLPQTSATS